MISTAGASTISYAWGTLLAKSDSLRAYSDAVQVDVSYFIAKGLELRMAYKYNNVQTTFRAGKRPMLFQPKHIGHFNMSYITPKGGWKFDATLHLQGKGRLPDDVTSAEGPVVQYSPVFPRLMAHVTKMWKRFEVYAGGENLTGFTQENPIQGADNPYGPDFDATGVWGPIFGQVAYVGFRYRLQ